MNIYKSSPSPLPAPPEAALVPPANPLTPGSHPVLPPHNFMIAADSVVVLLELDVQWDLAGTH